MDDERVVDEIVTKFVLNTCRLRPQPRKHAVQAAMMCSVLETQRREWGIQVDDELIPLISGSMAEFYIEPMLPHIGDIDMMVHISTVLAIPLGHPPPTQLPTEFHNNYVMVFEIIDSHLSGYVYLNLRYLLTKCTDSGRYSAIEYEERVMFLILKHNGREFHGPALVYQGTNHQLPVDFVHSARCLSWPPQADNWPVRHRNYGWPDSATVECVVSNGCDMVPVAHRLCKQNEYINKRQWRLSFSRAEIVLLNSWMSVQQIVYHLLRVFIKTEQLTESADISQEGTLSNYHIKTLMLWACELKPKSWWTDDLHFVRICAELLHTLAVWLTEARCKHYFINSCNLVHKSFALKMTASRLLLMDKHWLSSWFVNCYVRQSVQICPESVSRLFDDVSTTIELENAVSAVVDWRLRTTTIDTWEALLMAEYHISYYVSTLCISARNCAFCMTELQKIDAGQL